MNDNDRAALVEELAAENEVAFEQGFSTPRALAENTVLVIDRLLAERHGETTVPDAERVERAAEALFEEDVRGYWSSWGELVTAADADPDEADGEEPAFFRRLYLRMARAALAAAGPEPIADAERVERAARAIADVASGFKRENWEGYVHDGDEDECHEWYRDQARAALAAAGPEADPDLTAAYMAGVAKGEGWLDAALEDESFESPLHKAMGSWVTQDFLWRLNNEGEPGHEVAMQHARHAITNFLNAARNATALAAKQEGGER